DGFVDLGPNSLCGPGSRQAVRYSMLGYFRRQFPRPMLGILRWRRWAEVLKLKREGANRMKCYFDTKRKYDFSNEMEELKLGDRDAIVVAVGEGVEEDGWKSWGARPSTEQLILEADSSSSEVTYH
ncbi:hypothetical protein Salat_1182000, partial [Sesamum alatum]